MPAVRARLVYDAGEGLDQSAIKQIFVMDNFAQGKNISCSPRELYYIGETANWSCTGAWGGLSEPLQAEIRQTVGLGFWFMLKRPTEYGGNWVKLKCKKAL